MHSIWNQYPELSRAYSLVRRVLSGRDTRGRFMTRAERNELAKEALDILSRIGTL